MNMREEIQQAFEGLQASLPMFCLVVLGSHASLQHSAVCAGWQAPHAY